MCVHLPAEALLPERGDLFKRKQEASYWGVEGRSHSHADPGRNKVALVLRVPESLEHTRAEVHGRAVPLAYGASKSSADVNKRALGSDLMR